MYLSIIIPAYNEAGRLAETLKEIDEYLQNQNYPSSGSEQAFHEIIVVNDGSKDKTAEIVKNLIPTIKNLRLINNKENRGKGYVVRQGMLKAKGKYRLFTDADNSTSIEQVEKMWPEFKAGYEIIIGSRDIKKGAIIVNSQSWMRKKLGGIFNLLVRTILGLWEYNDTQCGFKGFSAKAANDIFSRAKIDRWAFDPEILVIGKKLGYKIKEIPINWAGNSETKLKVKDMFKMGLDLIKIKTR